LPISPRFPFDAISDIASAEPSLLRGSDTV
jgi:hypothetical protein